VGTKHLVTLSHGYMLTLTCKRLFQSSDDDRAGLLVRMDPEQRLVQFCELEERSTRERFWAVERLNSQERRGYVLIFVKCGGWWRTWT
jgi:hypothetical protein